MVGQLGSMHGKCPMSDRYFELCILYVHVEDDIISPRCDTIFDIHFRLRDTADFVPHTLLWGILNNAGSPINTY